MSKEELSGEQLSGCILSLWSLFVTGPIWLVLFFVVLNALGDSIPTWGWVLYWIYVPAAVLGIITNAVGKQLLSKTQRPAQTTMVPTQMSAPTLTNKRNFLMTDCPEVKGCCPACGNVSLFLGKAGFVTCSIAECKRPDAASDILSGWDGTPIYHQASSLPDGGGRVFHRGSAGVIVAEFTHRGDADLFVSMFGEESTWRTNDDKRGKETPNV